ncbi:MAG: DNA polymerase ligase N-terminal domain-containing protein [Micromonosporaceae bacterium]
MGDRLDQYRAKRDAARTPEPVPTAADATPRGNNDTFVIQQHHARRLHWDLRLEREGVLVSWAVPRGIPRDPERNHLAVHTEDHPLEYADFHGDIPEGEYGAGRMHLFDRGTYETEKWRDDEVIVVLHGTRVAGRFVLFRTRGKDWMIHRMDPPEPGWTPMPQRIEPMLAAPASRLPADDEAWGYELRWPGVRAIAHIDGAQLRLLATDGDDIAGTFPSVRPIAEALAPTECVLDGVIVALGPDGGLRTEPLRPENAVAATGRRRAARVPVLYVIFDLLWLEGRSTVELGYADRRELLTELGLANSHWQTPPHFAGGGSFARQAAREQGLPGVVAKRLDAPYQPGRRTRTWLSVDV